MRLLLDTNVLLRRAQVASPQHQAAKDSLLALIEANVELCLVPQVIYEYWVASTRPVAVNGLGMDLDAVDQAVKELTQDFTLLKDERGIFGRWQTVVVAQSVLGKNAHDARLVAAMQRHGVTFLLTFNQADFVRFPGITAVSPIDIVSGIIPAGLI